MYKFTSWLFTSLIFPLLALMFLLNNIDFYGYNYNILLTYLISAPFHLLYSPYIQYESYLQQIFVDLVLFINAPITMLSKIDYFYTYNTFTEFIFNIAITYFSVPYIFVMAIGELFD